MYSVFKYLKVDPQLFLVFKDSNTCDWNGEPSCKNDLRVLEFQSPLAALPGISVHSAHRTEPRLPST